MLCACAILCVMALAELPWRSIYTPTNLRVFANCTCTGPAVSMVPGAGGQLLQFVFAWPTSSPTSAKASLASTIMYSNAALLLARRMMSSA